MTGRKARHVGDTNVVRPMTCALILLIAGSVEAQVASQQADAKETKTLNLTAYAELLRSDVGAQKVAIITEVMQFTEAEDAVFWPIYREFDARNGQARRRAGRHDRGIRAATIRT